MKNSSLIRIGILVTTIFVMFIVGMSYLKGTSLFNNENIYHVVYTHIDGLSKGSPVDINGFRVGTVSHIEVASDRSGRLIVSLKVSKKYDIPRGSKAQLINTDIMGTKGVRLVLANQAQLQQTGDTLQADIEQGLTEMLSTQIVPIKNKAEKLVSSLDSVLSQVQLILNANTRENMIKTFASLKNSAANVEQITSTFSTLSKNEQVRLSGIINNVHSISENLKNNNQSLTKIVTNIDKISDSIAKSDIKATIYHANRVLTSIDSITKKINRGEGSLGKLVNNDTLYRNVQTTTDNLNRLVIDLKENPKRYVQFSMFGGSKSDKKKEKVSKKESDTQKDTK